MANVRCDLDPVAGLHVEHDVTVLEAQTGGTGQQHDELVVGLVVPEAGRARLSGRDDALDAHAGRVDEKVDLLFGPARRQRREKVSAAQASLSP